MLTVEVLAKKKEGDGCQSSGDQRTGAPHVPTPKVISRQISLTIRTGRMPSFGMEDSGANWTTSSSSMGEAGLSCL